MCAMASVKSTGTNAPVRPPSSSSSAGIARMESSTVPLPVPSTSSSSAGLASPLASREVVALPHFLNWRDRPKYIQSAVADSLRELSKHANSAWTSYNGQNTYCICGIDEHQLFKRIIQNDPQRKDFYAMDVGAGNFQWLDAFTKFINSQPDLPDDIRVHIFGVRGESYYGDEITKIGRCELHKLGAFTIEEMEDEFPKRGYKGVQGLFDLIFTKWCVRHVNDAPGTYVQLVNHLRPANSLPQRTTGFLLMDGFFLLHEHDSFESVVKNHEDNIRLTTLLLDTQMPVLIQRYDGGRSLNHFILQRPTDVPCQIPMRYDGMVWEREGTAQIESRNITRFVREPQPGDGREFEYVNDEKVFYGRDRTLFMLLRNLGVLRRNVGHLYHPPLLWRSIYKKPDPIMTSLQHQYAAQGNIEGLRKCLEDGQEDINEPDALGNSPLCIAIMEKQWGAFEFLLAKGAGADIANAEGMTPLHLVAKFDRDGRYLEALLKQKVMIHGQDNTNKTAMDHALLEKNPAAVRELLLAGAIVNKEAIDQLKDAVFAPLFGPEGSQALKQKLLITPLHEAARAGDEALCERLLQQGADRNAKDLVGNTPVHYALVARKPNTLALLLKNKAEISQEEEQIVRRDAVFAGINTLTIAPRHPSNVLGNIVGWIRLGDCVVLHSNYKSGRIFHRCDKEKPVNPAAQRMIYVNIDPSAADLLEDGEWPLYIGKQNLCTCGLKEHATNPNRMPYMYSYTFPHRPGQK